MNPSRRISRRRILRGVLGGAGVSVALPPFEAWLNAHGEAFADGTPLPKPFGVWFFGNGVRPERWVPKATGGDWPLSAELQPLGAAGVKEYVSVVSGLDAKGDKYVHSGPASAVLTGTGLLHPAGDGGTPEGPSIDVLVSAHLGKDTPFRSLETGVYNHLGNGTAYRALSHRGPDAANLPETDPRKVFARLFGAGTPGERRAGGATVVDHTVKHRRSVLDAVMGDCAALAKDLSTSDKARLEQHCDAVRGIERRLATTPAAAPTAGCSRPDVSALPASRSVYNNGAAPYKELNEAHSLLIAHALTCDLTRVFTHCYTNPASHWWFKTEGWNESFHVLSHDEPGDQPKVHEGVLFTMQRLAETLAIFKKTPFGAGNLLDRLAMLVTSDCSLGKTHDPRNMPFLVVGKAGGALRPNVHYRGTGESVTRATLHVARATGAPLPAFGTGAQRVTDDIPELRG